jgi:hypothetical protein
MVMCMRMENLLFLDSVLFLTMALRSLSEAFGLTASKSWYPHYFNTKATKDYVGRITDIRYYEPDDMKESERSEFLR